LIDSVLGDDLRPDPNLGLFPRTPVDLKHHLLYRRSLSGAAICSWRYELYEWCLFVYELFQRWIFMHFTNPKHIRNAELQI